MALLFVLCVIIMRRVVPAFCSNVPSPRNFDIGGGEFGSIFFFMPTLLLNSEIVLANHLLRFPPCGMGH